MRRGALVLAMLVGCGDPVRDARIEALRPEREGVQQGPLHRAGQPCLTCHDGSGPRELSVAGTVYRTEGSSDPVAGVRVELTDSLGTVFTTATNCAGNFFVEPADFTPAYPMRVALQAGAQRIEMDSPIQRDGSCATCHARATSNASAGVVYLHTDDVEAPAGACP